MFEDGFQRLKLVFRSNKSMFFSIIGCETVSQFFFDFLWNINTTSVKLNSSIVSGLIHAATLTHHQTKDSAVKLTSDAQSNLAV